MRTGAVRVLVVDEQPACAMAFARALERKGFLTSVAADCAAALQLIVTDPHGYDVLLTDDALPGLTGAELIASARLLVPGLPALICSRAAVPSRADRTVPVLLKPVPCDLLVQQVAARAPDAA